MDFNNRLLQNCEQTIQIRKLTLKKLCQARTICIINFVVILLALISVIKGGMRNPYMVILFWIDIAILVFNFVLLIKNIRLTITNKHEINSLIDDMKELKELIAMSNKPNVINE
jgi:hypothetical protein